MRSRSIDRDGESGGGDGADENDDDASDEPGEVDMDKDEDDGSVVVVGGGGRQEAGWAVGSDEIDGGGRGGWRGWRCSSSTCSSCETRGGESSRVEALKTWGDRVDAAWREEMADAEARVAAESQQAKAAAAMAHSSAAALAKAEVAAEAERQSVLARVVELEARLDQETNAVDALMAALRGMLYTPQTTRASAVGVYRAALVRRAAQARAAVAPEEYKAWYAATSTAAADRSEMEQEVFERRVSGREVGGLGYLEDSEVAEEMRKRRCEVVSSVEKAGWLEAVRGAEVGETTRLSVSVPLAKSLRGTLILERREDVAAFAAAFAARRGLVNHLYVSVPNDGTSANMILETVAAQQPYVCATATLGVFLGAMEEGGVGEVGLRAGAVVGVVEAMAGNGRLLQLRLGARETRVPVEVPAISRLPEATAAEILALGAAVAALDVGRLDHLAIEGFVLGESGVEAVVAGLEAARRRYKGHQNGVRGAAGEAGSNVDTRMGEGSKWALKHLNLRRTVTRFAEDKAAKKAAVAAIRVRLGETVEVHL